MNRISLYMARGLRHVAQVIGMRLVARGSGYRDEARGSWLVAQVIGMRLVARGSWLRL